MSVNRKKICYVIGDPVAHSLSPAMHHAAYRALGIESEYEFLRKQVSPLHLKSVIDTDLRKQEVCAFAVTFPHKEAIIPYLDEIDETAKKIGAVNTVLHKNGRLIGYNTDWLGALHSLRKNTELKYKNVAILGSGGSARAIIYGLAKEPCNVTLFSRNEKTAHDIATQYHCVVVDWSEIASTLDADIIINTTPLGREDDSSPIPKGGITQRHIIFDVNYRKGGTLLYNSAKENGAFVIDGLEMLLQQGLLQVELYTGLKAPEEAMRKALENETRI